MELQEQVTQYWSERAKAYGASRLAQLRDQTFDDWRRILLHTLGEGRGRRALDAGTGSGFLAVILESLGFRVVGIDPSRDMLASARETLEALGCEGVTLCGMDAQAPDFADGAFDVVVSRNVTWTLPDPAAAYAQWCRVLRAGGTLLNVDGNYREMAASLQAAVPAQLRARREALVQALPLCRLERPAWDCEVLSGCGIREIRVERDFGEWSGRILGEARLSEPPGTFLLMGKK